jgi:hypothetical protein
MRSLLLVPILVVIVACSHNESIQAESNGATGTGGHKMQGAGGGPSSTAAATTGAGGSGAGSCCSEPVHVAGHVKTISAETDASQLATVVAVPVGNEQYFKVLDGPFVVTDASGNTNPFQLYAHQGSDCSTHGGQDPLLAAGAAIQNQTMQVHGARGFVQAGWRSASTAVKATSPSAASSPTDSSPARLASDA